jgi:hypothetical protein
LGTGICKAVTAVFAGAKDFICHFHFLRDAGKDLLEPAHRQLRGCLRQHAFSTRLSELARQARQVLAETEPPQPTILSQTPKPTASCRDLKR